MKDFETGSSPADATDQVSASRVILASQRTLFRVFLDAETFGAWRAPAGLAARFERFEAGAGGGYRMRLIPERADDGQGAGASVAIEARFLEFLPDETVVEAIRIDSGTDAPPTEVLLTTLFEPAREGTKVTLRATPAPTPAERRAALLSSLRALAALTE